VLPGKFEGFSYTMAWNVAGTPAAVVRCGELDGLPICIQLVTKPWRDMLALHIAGEIQKQLGGWQAPPLGAHAGSLSGNKQKRDRRGDLEFVNG